MESPLIEELRDDVLRKIGKNVVNLQRMEAMLKSLVASAGLDGPISELRDLKRTLNESVAKRSMGVLVEDLFRSIYSDSNTSEPPEVLNESWISYKYRVEVSEEDAQDFKNTLTLVVSERNKLIHQMLCKFDADSVESCKELGAVLDLQNENLMPVFKRLQSLLRSNERAKGAYLKALEEKIRRDRGTA